MPPPPPHTHTHIHAHTHTYTHTHSHTQKHTRARAHTHTHTHTELSNAMRPVHGRVVLLVHGCPDEQNQPAQPERGRTRTTPTAAMPPTTPTMLCWISKPRRSPLRDKTRTDLFTSMRIYDTDERKREKDNTERRYYEKHYCTLSNVGGVLVFANFARRTQREY